MNQHEVTSQGNVWLLNIEVLLLLLRITAQWLGRRDSFLDVMRQKVTFPGLLTPKGTDAFLEAKVAI